MARQGSRAAGEGDGLVNRRIGPSSASSSRGQAGGLDNRIHVHAQPEVPVEGRGMTTFGSRRTSAGVTERLRYHRCSGSGGVDGTMRCPRDQPNSSMRRTEKKAIEEHREPGSYGLRKGVFGAVVWMALRHHAVGASCGPSS